MFINLTPNVIKVKVQDTAQGTFHIRACAPEPVSARVAAVEEVIGLIDTTGLTFTVSKHTFGQIEGLPEPQAGGCLHCLGHGPGRARRQARRFRP